MLQDFAATTNGRRALSVEDGEVGLPAPPYLRVCFEPCKYTRKPHLAVDLSEDDSLREKQLRDEQIEQGGPAAAAAAMPRQRLDQLVRDSQLAQQAQVPLVIQSFGARQGSYLLLEERFSLLDLSPHGICQLVRSDL
eukprot:scaffold411573_cov35-Prasinocladus_malaysianus.AAC.1